MVCGTFSSLRDDSGGFFSQMTSRKAKCVECDALFESEKSDLKDETEWELIEGPSSRVGESKSKRWKNELRKQEENTQPSTRDTIIDENTEDEHTDGEPITESASKQSNDITSDFVFHSRGEQLENLARTEAENDALPIADRFNSFIRELSAAPDRHESDYELLKKLTEQPPRTGWQIAVITCTGYWVLWLFVASSITEGTFLYTTMSVGLFAAWLLLPLSIYKDSGIARDYCPLMKLQKNPTVHPRAADILIVVLSLVPFLSILVGAFYLLIRWNNGKESPTKAKHKKRVLELANWEYRD